MSIRSRLSLTCALSLVAACGGVVSWETVCGCVPATVGLAEDLRVDPSIQFTPDVLEGVVDDRLSEQRRPVDLKAIRSLGYAFDRNCHERRNLRIRCTFWLWSHDEMNRGIELNLRESDLGQDLQLKAHYVYERQER
jgi:hypothetical protein